MPFKSLYKCPAIYRDLFIIIVIIISIFTNALARGSNEVLFTSVNCQDNHLSLPKDHGNKQDSSLIYINTFIENGSDLNWEYIGDGTIIFDLAYDYERVTLNRAYEHWHFLLNARAGSDITLIFQNFNEIYNGRSVPFDYSWSADCVVSPDGKKWRHTPAEWIEGNKMKVRVHMESDSLFVAQVEPYRLSDLQRLFSRIIDDPRVKIISIGESVERRKIHIIQVGHDDAPHRIFIRARAHPWEAGTNWVVEGIINTLLQHTDEVREFLDNYSVYILPMANIDGVVHGVTRFNMNGMDLNRNFTKPADPILSPENAAMEHWLEDMIAKGLKPDLAIDFHNDSNGNLSFASSGEKSEVYVRNMKSLENLVRNYSWFSESSSFDGSPAFEEGLMSRYGIDGLVYELNAHWVKGLNKKPLSEDWLLLGKQLCKVFHEYFQEMSR